jgi:hypothetical protein
MHYRSKYQVFDALKPRYASCQVYYEMDKVSPQVKSKVIKSIEQGYHTTAGGETGILYDAVCAQYELPVTRFLKPSKKDWHFWTEYSDDVLYEKLIEFSKADCAAHLIELSARPERTTRYGVYNDANDFREHIRSQESGLTVWKYPDGYWHRRRLGMKVNCLKDVNLLRDILDYPKALGVYNAKAQEAIALLRSRGSLVIEYKPD